MEETELIEESTNPETSPENATAEPIAKPAPVLVLTPKPVPPAKPDPAEKAAAKQKTPPEDPQAFPFSVTVGTVYDGPMDLLLDLIRKQNIDIYDIPIARITAQFLDYTHQLKQADVDAAGEFIYVASLLIHIKSQMLQQKQLLEDASWSQPGLRQFLADEGITSTEADREIDATTIDLVRVFQDILTRLRDRPIHEISEDTVTVAQMIDYVRRRLLMEDKPISLRKLLHNAKSERALICTFLA